VIEDTRRHPPHPGEFSVAEQTGLEAPDVQKRGRFSWIAGRLGVLLAVSAPLGLVVVLGIGMATGVGDAPLGDVDSGIGVATDFTLPRLEGGTFTLGEHADGPVFLYFWASWCVPCRVEAPLIESLWPEYEERGYTFVGVNIIDSESAARSFVEEFQLSFPILLDGQGEVYLEYGVYAVPESFFLAPGLQVRTKFLGALEEEPLRALLDKLGAPQ
jgi:cytochrome c biogenesis protein CcmG, thiol:disulfide interchange protein DsbE